MAAQRFNWTGFFTVFISLLALGFSFGTYYYSNIYINNNLTASFQKPPKFYKIDKAGAGEFSVEIVFVNKGNKPVTVKDVEFGYVYGKKTLYREYVERTDTIDNIIYQSLTCEQLPILIQPNEIKIITGIGTRPHLVPNDIVAMTADSTEKVKSLRPGRLQLYFNIYAIDSQGELKSKEQKMQCEIINHEKKRYFNPIELNLFN